MAEHLVGGNVIDAKKRKNKDKSEQDIGFIFENASLPYLIFELDPDNRLVSANSRMVDLFIDDDGPVGRPVTDVFPRSFADELIIETGQVFKDCAASSFESTIELGDDVNDVFIYIVPLFTGGGAVATVMVNVTDKSNSRASELSRIETMAQNEASRLKSEFLEGMSHELRTPLNSIIGFSELMQDQKFGELNEKQLRQIFVIHSNGKSLLNLLNDILDYQGLNSGLIDLKFKSFTLDRLIEDVHNEFAAKLGKKHQNLVVEIGSYLDVWADEQRVKQCLNNLLSNAIKFTPADGNIRINARKDDSKVIVTVSDDGRGIPQDKLGNIFQPFYRVDGSSTADAGGTGMGLTITSTLVEMMGGHIWVESRDGRGSEFHFTIPTNPP